MTIMDISPPYLLFLGDIADPLSAKTSRGIAQWRPEKCLGQLSMPGCRASLGLPELTIQEAVAQGARTFILGLANSGGRIADDWLPYIRQALEHGMDIASGLHQKVGDIAEIRELADRRGRRIFDVRHPGRALPVGTGKKRPGKRILAVGTDCSVGKMYTALALEREMKERGLNVDFRATGQTGILIAGGGVSVDAVIADFISGAVEELAPANDSDHWDVIEGQGSLFNPSFAGVSLGLLHGAQPDVLVLCHEAGRAHMRGLPHLQTPDIQKCINANLGAAHLTNPAAFLGGIAVNSSALGEAEARDYCRQMSEKYAAPCVDPLRHGISPVLDFILARGDAP